MSQNINSKGNTGTTVSIVSKPKIGFFTKMRLKVLDSNIDNLQEAMKWDINRNTPKGEQKWHDTSKKLKDLEKKREDLTKTFGIK